MSKARSRLPPSFSITVGIRAMREVSLGSVGLRPFDPGLAVRGELLLPDGDGLLEAVDAVPARLERLRTVRAGHRDDHRGLADLQPARPVRDGDPRVRPALADL